jgi:hypothetical protein
LSDQPVATAQAGRRWWATLLVAAALAALAIVLFATSAFSSSGGSAGSTGGTPAVQQVQQTPGQGQDHNCPNRSGQRPSSDQGNAILNT